MCKLVTKYRKVIAGVLSILLYFTLLTLLSFTRSTETKIIEEDFVSYRDFCSDGPTENVIWADENGLHIRDSQSGVKVFSSEVSLRDLQWLQIRFIVECPQGVTEEATLHVDLFADGYDEAEQEFTVSLHAGRNEVTGVIDKGVTAPDKAQLRIFCLDPVECTISGLCVQKMAQVSYYRGQIICIILMAIFAVMMVIVLNMGADKLKTYSNVPIVDTTGGSTACEKETTVLRCPINAERWMIALPSAVCFLLHLHIGELPILKGSERMRRRHSAVSWRALFLIFIISTIVRGVIAYHAGEYSIFGDEFLHVKLAQSIAAGNGLAVRGARVNYTECLYSIVLSPVFLLTHNTQAAHVMILWINAALMSSAVFPIFLIAKKFLTNPRHIWLAIAYGLLIGEMNYTLQVMQENLNYPLMMWFFLAFTYVVLEKRNNITAVSGLGAFAFLLSYCKQMNQAIVLAVILYFALQFLSDKKMRRQTARDALVYTGTYLVLKNAFGFVLNMITADAIRMGDGRGRILQSLLNSDTMLKLVYPAIIYVVFTVLATGIFPLPLLVGNWKAISEKSQKMLTLTLSYIFISIGAICLIVVPNENLGDLTIRFHSRYFFYAFILIIILFFHLYEDPQKENTGGPEPVFLLGYGAVLIAFIPITIAPGSIADGASTLYLYWLLLNEADVLMNAARCIFIGIIALGMYFLCKKHPRKVLGLTAVILSLAMLISFIQYMENMGIAQNWSTMNDALILNEYLANRVNEQDSEEDILLIVADEFAFSTCSFECYFNKPYRLAGRKRIDSVVGQAIDFSKVTLTVYNRYWVAPYQEPPEFIISASKLPLQGYDEVNLGLDSYHLLRWNGEEVKLLRSESNIYGDRWLGDTAATLQVAGSLGCTDAVLRLTVDNILQGSAIAVSYKDGSGYLGSFIIPSTSEAVELEIPIYKSADAAAYTVEITPTQAVQPNNGDTRLLSFRLWDYQITESAGEGSSKAPTLDNAA